MQTAQMTVKPTTIEIAYYGPTSTLGSCWIACWRQSDDWEIIHRRSFPYDPAKPDGGLLEIARELIGPDAVLVASYWLRSRGTRRLVHIFRDGRFVPW